MTKRLIYLNRYCFDKTQAEFIKIKFAINRFIYQMGKIKLKQI